MAGDDLELGGALGQVEHELEQEAVELRLGQRVGALVLDRVLGGRDQERGRQRAAHAIRGDLTLLHRLEQRRLGLRGRAVDLVGEQDVGEDRPLAELELAGLRVVDDRSGDVAGHQVGGELHPPGLERQRAAEAAHEQGLGDARHPLEQHVAAGEQGDEEAGDGAILSDDGLADFGADAGEGLAEFGV